MFFFYWEDCPNYYFQCSLRTLTGTDGLNSTQLKARHVEISKIKVNRDVEIQDYTENYSQFG